MIAFSWWAVVAVLVVLYIAYLRLTRQIIREADGTPYLYRYFILPRIEGWGRVYLHKFARSDYDRCLHDHPWHYASLILWRGYWEHADGRMITNRAKFIQGWSYVESVEWRKRMRPLTFVRRGAGWRHRVVLLTDKNGKFKPAWTLFFTSPKVREWGFWTGLRRWCHHEAYDLNNDVCNEPEKEF